MADKSTLKPERTEYIGTRGNGYVRNTYVINGIPIIEDVSPYRGRHEHPYYSVGILIPMSEEDGDYIAKRYGGCAIPCNTEDDKFYVVFHNCLSFDLALNFVRDRVERGLFSGVQSIAEFTYKPPRQKLVIRNMEDVVNVLEDVTQFLGNEAFERENPLAEAILTVVHNLLCVACGRNRKGETV